MRWVKFACSFLFGSIVCSTAAGVSLNWNGSAKSLRFLV